MIVRVLDDGQYEVEADVIERLNELDSQATQALDGEDEAGLEQSLAAMAELVRSSGKRLPDDELTASEVVVPPADLSLAETRKLMSAEGLIPDLAP